jgi:hypothetical protein
MKKIFLSTSLIISTAYFAHAQTSIGVQNDLRNVTIGGANASSTVISSFSNNDVKGSRYLFDNWTPGSVTTINNEVYSNNYNFNFDKINQDIYAEYASNNLSVLLDKSKVKRFTIGSSTFINSSMLPNTSPNTFYQVLVEDSSDISLYKLTTTKFVKANPNDIMNARTGNFSNEYLDNVRYYVRIKNGDLNKVSLNENNIRKVLKDKKVKVEEYLNMSSTDFDEGKLINLIKYINQ